MLHFVVAAWLSSIALFAGAQQQADLYSTSALVLNQSSDMRHQAATEALADVFVRVSGSRDIVKYAAVQLALTNANSYLYEFEYSSTDETLAIDGVEQAAVRLSMKFSSGLVDNLLKREQLPYWPANRPDVLLWAAKADGRGGQQFISNDAPVTNVFTHIATERGIVFVKPVFDLEDRLALPVSRLWVLDEVAISKASTRYRTDAVLAGRFSPIDKDQWRGNFTLFYQAQEKPFVAYGENTETIAMDISEQVADYFSAIFTSVINGQSSLKKMVLVVDNVKDFTAYVNSLGYVENLPMVQKVSLMAVETNKIKMMLHYRGDQAVMFRTFSLDKRLTENAPKVYNKTPMSGVLTAPPLGTVDNPLQFVWQFK